MGLRLVDMPRPSIIPKLFWTRSNCFGIDRKSLRHCSKPIQKMKFNSEKLFLVKKVLSKRFGSIDG